MRTLGRVADSEEYIVRHQHAAMGGMAGGPDGLLSEAQLVEDGGRWDVRRDGIGHDAVGSFFGWANDSKLEASAVRRGYYRVDDGRRNCGYRTFPYHAAASL